jgi:hypothetical protein
MHIRLNRQLRSEAEYAVLTLAAIAGVASVIIAVDALAAAFFGA